MTLSTEVPYQEYATPRHSIPRQSLKSLSELLRENKAYDSTSIKRSSSKMILSEKVDDPNIIIKKASAISPRGEPEQLF